MTLFFFKLPHPRLILLHTDPLDRCPHSKRVYEIIFHNYPKTDLIQGKHRIQIQLLKIQNLASVFTD